jgi:hypothetical protein
MKQLLLILLVSCSSGMAWAQKEYDLPYSTKSLAGQNINEVEATTSGGNVSVESVAAGQEKVEVFIWPSNRNKNNSVSKEEIQKRLDELYDLSVEVAGNKLTATAKPKHQNMNWKSALSISFRIFTSKNITTHLTTSGGNIDLKAIAGQQKVTTSGGNITIDHVTGKLKGVTSGGNIDVKDSHDDIDLMTSGGNIEANNCTGKVELTTSGGDLRLVNLNGDIKATTSGGNVRANDIKGDLNAHTSGGNVDMAGLACNLTTGTSGGDIKVAITTAGKFVKIRNSGGKVALELPAGKGYDMDLSADKIKADNLGNFKGKVDDNEINGQVNGGGTEVKVNASSGRLVLTFK